MSRVEIISASAGTGKTTRLASLIHEAVRDQTARPEAILATTFTRRAAAELAERARQALLEVGETAAAQRLHAARIGTVNGVCGGLVRDFAFLHGLSPRVAVLDEKRASDEPLLAGAQKLPPELMEELEDLHARMGSPDDAEKRFGRSGGWEWRRDVVKIVEQARSNAMDPERFAEFTERSIATLLPFLQLPASGGDPVPAVDTEAAHADVLDRALDEAVEQFLASVDLDSDTTDKTRKACGRARAARARGARNLPWSDWAHLAELAPGKKSRHAAEAVLAAAAAHDRHPRLHRDLWRAVRAVFEAAAYVLEAYQAHKRRLGVIDFVDQETEALKLLQDETVRAQLGEEIDLVLVDEFQDTSPIQLAIFLELSKIAPRSVWVGDPKQAIYGFRGADPALMDAAIEALLRGQAPTTLERSYRSRPALVRLTSRLFAPAFAESGIPEALVRIEPGLSADPEGLGPLVERWQLEPGFNEKTGKLKHNVDLDLISLAAGVSALLADPQARVRDRTTNQARAIEPGDVSVLCLKNKECVKLARELEARGVRAVVGRPGLVATLEVRLVIAALRLWIDPADSLARAELGRWLEHSSDGDAWLKTVLEAKHRHALFGDLEPVEAICKAREPRAFAGVLAAFDLAVAAVGARERAVRFGNATARLANLDALRALAVGYVESCRSEGAPCSLRSLLGALEQLAGEGGDTQAAAERPDAVYISTLHRAKGLEWPVVVIADLSSRPKASALGVHLVPESEALDLEHPLSGRWIRYWPSPYGRKTKNVALLDRIQEDAATQAADRAASRESLRLVYVAWTRARDRLVYAGRPERLPAALLRVLSAAGEPLLSEPDDEGRVAWGEAGAEQELDLVVRVLSPDRIESPPPVPAEGYVPAGPRVHPPATLSPSELQGTAAVGGTFEIGERIPIAIHDDDEMRRLGNAVHAFLAADRPTLPDAERSALAGDLLERFGVRGALEALQLRRASDRLHRWIDAHWPDATWRREWPLLHKLAGGTLLRGVADLVLETDSGLVLLDHKSFPGSRTQATERAAEHAGQLCAYATALEAATQGPVLAAYIHLPVSGLMIQVELGG